MLLTYSQALVHRITAFSLPGQFAPWSNSSNRTLASSLPGSFIPWNFPSLDLSLRGTFAPRNECSRELLLPGTFALWNLRSHSVYSTIYWSHVHAMKNLHGCIACRSNHRLKYLSRHLYGTFALLCGGSCHNEPTLTGFCVMKLYSPVSESVNTAMCQIWAYM